MLLDLDMNRISLVLSFSKALYYFFVFCLLPLSIAYTWSNSLYKIYFRPQCYSLSNTRMTAEPSIIRSFFFTSFWQLTTYLISDNMKTVQHISIDVWRSFKICILPSVCKDLCVISLKHKQQCSQCVKKSVLSSHRRLSLLSQLRFNESAVEVSR